MSRNDLAAELSVVIAELRIARGWSRNRLASETGFSPSYISLLERGLRAPSLDTLQRIVCALGAVMTLNVELGLDKPDVRVEARLRTF